MSIAASNPDVRLTVDSKVKDAPDVAQPKERADIENQQFYGENAELLNASTYGQERHPALRVAFLRRVYATLSLQLVMTVAVSLVCMLNTSVRQFSINHAQAITWGTLIPCIVILLVLGCVKNEYPLNVMLLTAFTFLESMVIGSICAIYYATGAGIAVAQAAALTAVVFISLTAYCFVSKKDFSFLGGFLFTCLLLMIGWGFLNLVFGWQVTWIYSTLGALLFCGFILFDTYQISQRYDLDDYIVACIELYLDIINLFLYILQLFSNRND